MKGRLYPMKKVYVVESYIKYEGTEIIAVYDTYKKAKAHVDDILPMARSLEVDGRYEFIDYFFIKEYEPHKEYDFENGPETWSFEV